MRLGRKEVLGMTVIKGLVVWTKKGVLWKVFSQGDLIES